MLGLIGLQCGRLTASRRRARAIILVQTRACGLRLNEEPALNLTRERGMHCVRGFPLTYASGYSASSIPHSFVDRGTIASAPFAK